MRTGDFLSSTERVERYDLDAETAARKRAMLACHASQKEILQYFDPAIERYRRAPEYNFTVRPTTGVLYESFGWGLGWNDWLARVEAAG
jgi:hypothetical protein